MVKVAAVGGALTGMLAGSVPAAADSAADFYKGKRLRMVIGYTTGGGYDIYARALARYMGKHIPGQPSVVPQNMPGAGSLLATNWLYNGAPRDGTVIAAINRGIPFEPLTGGKGVQFDPLKFGWIGSLGKEVNVTIAWHASGVRTPQDLFTHGLIAGGTGSGADSAIYPAIMNNLLGAKIKLIAGYPGGNDVNLALERGEVEGRPSPSWSSLRSSHPEWIRDNKIIPLWQLSLSKHPDLPEVPLAIDFAKTPEDRQIMEFFFARQEMSRPYLTSPEIAPERLAALREAFMATTRDPEFVEASKMQDLELDPIDGAAIDALLSKVFATPKDVIARATDIARSTVPTEQVKLAETTIAAPIAAVEGQGAAVRFNSGTGPVTLRISASRSAISIAGQQAKREALKPGMVCTFTHSGDGTEAKAVHCR
jgi:tripartite-type tricarboxylate transporter receptor subunit TctC